VPRFDPGSCRAQPQLATEWAKGKVTPGLNVHGLGSLGLEPETHKAIMAHESDEAGIVYEARRREWCPGAESNHRHCDFQMQYLARNIRYLVRSKSV
jgi:hypothetical protein